MKKIKRESKDTGKAANMPNAFEVWRQLDPHKGIEEWRKLLDRENSQNYRAKQKKEDTAY
jgi:hypothetical protein